MDFTKPPNKIFVYAVVGVVVFLWLSIWLFGPKREKVEPGAPLDKMMVTLAQSPKVEKKEVEESQEELVPGGWGRDPFSSPYLAVREAETPPEEGVSPQPDIVQQGPQYKISTILISDSNRLAVIEDRTYGEGDSIGGEKITAINLDHIVLSGDFGERVLYVPQPQTKITVESTGRQ